MKKSQYYRIHAARNCVWCIVGMVIGAGIMYATLTEPELTKRELEYIRVLTSFESQCGLIERK